MSFQKLSKTNMRRIIFFSKLSEVCILSVESSMKQFNMLMTITNYYRIFFTEHCFTKFLFSFTHIKDILINSSFCNQFVYSYKSRLPDSMASVL